MRSLSSKSLFLSHFEALKIIISIFESSKFPYFSMLSGHFVTNYSDKLNVKSNIFVLLISSFFFVSCAKELQTLTVTTTNGVTAATESSYCSSVTTYTTATAVSGVAQFYYRATDVSIGLTGSPVAAAIKYAEIRVTNSTGATVQCGTTGANGEISLNIPRIAGTYTITVYSRSDNSHVKVSVLEDTSGNAPYSINGNVTITAASTTANVGTISAYARQSESAKIEGGAFNIHYNIWHANEYLRSNSGNAAFVAPKVTVYWKAGFNPYSYFGDPGNAISFYQSGQRKLYILGGSAGNVKTVDTDHFDDSIILHEYGHFLEDVYAISESPGGSHSGTATIDPRLAWSEGWANFFQAAVLSDQYYIDTEGFSNDPGETGESGRVMISFDLKESGATASRDAVTMTNEGIFREVAISRALLKAISPTSDTYGVGLPFENLWRVFSSTTSGFANTGLFFRNVGAFFSYLDPIVSSEHAANVANWSNMRSNEKQPIANIEYANPITSAASCVAYPRTISPVVDFTATYGIIDTDNNGVGDFTLDQPHLLRSSDYFSFYHDGSNQSVKLLYSQAVAPTVDLDLVVYSRDYIEYPDYKEKYYGQSNSTIAVRSSRVNPTFETGSEIVSMNGLAAGYYLVQVKANSYKKIAAQMGGQATYSLKLVKSSETFLCPAN